MTTTLSEQTQKLLEDRIRLGGYRNADEAVRALLDGKRSAELRARCKSYYS